MRPKPKRSGLRYAEGEGESLNTKTMRWYQRAPHRSTRRKSVNPCLTLVFAVLAGLGAAALGAPQQRSEVPRGVPRTDARFAVLGSESCRACHRSLYEAWEPSPHALSTAELTFDQAFDPKCAACHVPDASAFEDGVGCEACHGPGSAYAELDIMIDPLKSRAAGLQDAGETCAYCHNPGHSFHVERDLRAAARRIHPRPRGLLNRSRHPDKGSR